MTKRPHSPGADDELAELITTYGEQDGIANAILVVEDFTLVEDGTHNKQDDEASNTHSKEIEIPVIKELLMASSPVFRTMFTSRFKESETKKVNLKGKSLQQVLYMLDYLYPEKTRILTDSMAALLLPIAHEYEISRLKKLCIHKLGEMSAPRLEYITLANRFDLHDLLQKSLRTCIEKLTLENIEHEECLEVNHDLPDEYVRQILRQKFLALKQQILSSAGELGSTSVSMGFGCQPRSNINGSISFPPRSSSKETNVLENRIAAVEGKSKRVRQELEDLASRI